MLLGTSSLTFVVMKKKHFHIGAGELYLCQWDSSLSCILYSGFKLMQRYLCFKGRSSFRSIHNYLFHFERDIFWDFTVV